MERLRGLLGSVRASFFWLPALAVVVAFIGARFAVGVDVGSWVGEATVDSSRAVLSTVAVATITICATDIACADHDTICARRHLTTDLDPRRMIDNSRRPSSFVNSRTCTLCAIHQGRQTSTITWWTRHSQRSRSRHSWRLSEPSSSVSRATRRPGVDAMACSSSGGPC